MGTGTPRPTDPLRLAVLLAVLAGVALVVLAALYWLDVVQWFYDFTGARAEGGVAYGLWSGFMGANWTILGVVVLWYWHHTCHNRRCLRYGRHVTPRGYALCRRCVGRPLSELSLHEVHEDHR